MPYEHKSREGGGEPFSPPFLMESLRQRSVICPTRPHHIQSGGWRQVLRPIPALLRDEHLLFVVVSWGSPNQSLQRGRLQHRNSFCDSSGRWQSETRQGSAASGGPRGESDPCLSSFLDLRPLHSHPCLAAHTASSSFGCVTTLGLS